MGREADNAAEKSLAQLSSCELNSRLYSRTRAFSEVVCLHWIFRGNMAEGQGFEPWKAVTPCWFSRPVHSTALPSLRRGDFDEVRIQSQGNVQLFGTFGAENAVLLVAPHA